ncbi:MAG: hypothetical protein HYU68_10275 [Bacteroidetes bacterium]|nr:hypothetical protein [Bacteroidota bacterium]
MKKTLLSLIAFAAVSIAFAQNCTPDPQYTAPGVYPDSATGLAPAYVGLPYDETITTITPVDTCIVLIFPPCTVIPIDSVVIDNFSGLPAGFNVVSLNENNLNFVFPGGSTSCMRITGTATTGQEGTYPLTVSGLSWATVFGAPTSQPFNVDYYSLVIMPATGVEELSKTGFSVKQNSPNPFSSNSTIEYAVPAAGKVTVDVRNILGELIYTENTAA